MFLIITKKSIYRSIFFIGIFAFAVTSMRVVFNRRAITVSAEEGAKPSLAIVIDDFGYAGEGTEEMLALDIPLTCAIMPFSEKSAEDVTKVKNAGKEIIIHMPMESLTGKRSWVGEKGLFCTMTDDEIRSRLEEAFNIADGAVGLNNHMGSAIMEDKRCLTVVMDEVKKRGYIFLDSRTTANSKAKEISEKFGACLLGRDVFLDSTDDIEVVKKQLLRAAEIAVKTGTAIAIGHVGPEGGMVTVNAIKQMIPKIEEMGVELVTITQMQQIVCK